MKAPSSEKSTNASDVQVTDEDCSLSCCLGHERANLNQSCRQKVFFLTNTNSWCQRETLLPCFRLRHEAQLDCGMFRQHADPPALRRKLYCKHRTFPLHVCVLLFFEASRVHDTSIHNMKCDVEIRATPCFPSVVSACRDVVLRMFPFAMWTSKGEYGSGLHASTFCSVSFFRF